MQWLMQAKYIKDKYMILKVAFIHTCDLINPVSAPLFFRNVNSTPVWQCCCTSSSFWIELLFAVVALGNTQMDLIAPISHLNFMAIRFLNSTNVRVSRVTSRKKGRPPNCFTLTLYSTTAADDTLAAVGATAAVPSRKGWLSPLALGPELADNTFCLNICTSAWRLDLASSELASSRSAT